VSAGSGWVTFVSDYGLEDSYVGVCRGVIARTAPEVRVLDVCHAVAAQDVAQGAAVLASAVPYLPTGVHLALVDPPAVKTPQAVAVATEEGSVLLGPDNGLLSSAWEALGGIAAVHALTDAALHLAEPHRMFRGRDVFAPVAARLAAGLPVARVGAEVDPASLVRVSPRLPKVDADHVRGQVRAVDHFGNLALNIARADLEAAGIVLGDTVEVRMDGRVLLVPFTLTYGDVPAGRVAVCEDANRRIMIGVNLGRATDTLRARRGDPVVISQAPRQAPVPTGPIGVLDPPVVAANPVPHAG